MQGASLHAIEVIHDTSELVYPFNILSYSAWNRAIQLTQPNETNKASEAPRTAIHALRPPSGGSGGACSGLGSSVASVGGLSMSMSFSFASVMDMMLLST